MKTTVMLRPAFEWTCDCCGRDNFGRPGVRGRDALAAAIHERFGHQETAEPDEWIILPEEVTCVYCGAEFPTEIDD